jgi:glutamyl-tRNA synthetase
VAVPRVRFALSPSGDLHVGDARVALCNWLYARRHGGSFVLRIEDTGQDHAPGDSVAAMLDSLRWLGLTWDEGPDIGGPCEPYVQSARVERHRAAARRLFLEGHAYYCYCTAERLEPLRRSAAARGDAWQYDRRCLALSAEEAQALQTAGTPRVLRCKVPGGRTGFEDMVHGRIEFDGATVDDFVILQADGRPSPHLAVVADDMEMGMTDIIRGDEHLADAPTQVLLFQALGAPVPRFAHVPQMHGGDRTRLATVAECRRRGYLPEAMVDVLARPGRAPGDEPELMPLPALVERIDLAGLSGGAAVFDTGKLDRMNVRYLAALPLAVLAREVRSVLVQAGFGTSPLVAEESFVQRLVALLRPRMTRLTDAVEQARPLLEDVVAYTPEAVERHLGTPGLEGHVEALVGALGDTAPFDESHVEAAVRRVAATREVPPAALMDAIRVAITGRTSGPDLFEVLALLGRERTLARLEQLLVFLAAGPST